MEESKQDPGARPRNPTEILATLMSENARLALENKLLRENALLTLENKILVEGIGNAGNGVFMPVWFTQGDPLPSSEVELQNGHLRYPMDCSELSWQGTHNPFGGQQGEQAAAPRASPGATVAASRRHRTRGQNPLSQEPEPAAEPTTVMLRNLPNNYSRAMVLAMLHDEGFEGKYDFLYLPIDFKSCACLGYAFINLTDGPAAKAFWNTFNGYSRWMLPSRKVGNVSWSTPHQGLAAHIDRYRNSPVMHPSVPDEHKPVVFQGGVRVVFPEPTKAPRAPRVRNCR